MDVLRKLKLQTMFKVSNFPQRILPELTWRCQKTTGASLNVHLSVLTDEFHRSKVSFLPWDHLRNNGDSRGHSSFGGSVCVGPGTTVHSLPTRLSPLTRVCVVAWETWKDFTTSPEKVLIHTSTDRETRSSRKYLALRKHLHTGVQTPMSA